MSNTVDKKTATATATTATTVQNLTNKRGDDVMCTQIITLTPQIGKNGSEYMLPHFNMEEALRLPQSKFAQILTREYELAETLLPFKLGNRLISAFVYEVKREPRTLLNLLSYSVWHAIKSKDISKTAMIAEKIRDWADRVEEHTSQYENTADLIRAITGLDFELHAFHSEYTGSFIIDNTQEEYSYAIEEDPNAMITQLMEQKELQQYNNNARAKNALNWEGQTITPSVSKEEMIEELISRTPEQWEEAASYGAWAVAKEIVAKWLEDPRNELAIEYLQLTKRTSVAIYRKARRKYWDALAAMASLEKRMEYQEDLAHAAAKEGPVRLPSAAVVAGQVAVEVIELKKQHKELEFISMALEEIIDSLKTPLSIAKIDGETMHFPLYEAYFTFDPIGFIVKRHEAIATLGGERFGYDHRKAANKAALKALHFPVVEAFEVTQVVNNNPINKTLYKLSWDEAPQGGSTKVALLELIRKIRLLRYQFHTKEDSGMRSRGLEKMVKHFTMQNKKRFILADGRDDFLF